MYVPEVPLWGGGAHTRKDSELTRQEKRELYSRVDVGGGEGGGRSCNALEISPHFEGDGLYRTISTCRKYK